MKPATVDLSKFDNSWYSPGRSLLVRATWFFLVHPWFRATWLPGSGFRALLLRLFGAHVGAGVVIKPGVRVKNPWFLSLGDSCWLGEGCWIDNLAMVTVGANACVSQEAYLCTGNHDWRDPHFALIVKPITLGPGAWVGARAVVTPGVQLGECAVLAAGSVATKDIPPFAIHAGNPASFVRTREIVTR